MKTTRTLAMALTACCLGTALAETGRLFFDVAGNGGNESAPHPGNLSMTNPDAGLRPARFYIYWEFGRPGGNDSQNVLGLNFNVEIDDGTLTEAFFYNADIPNLGRRWQTAPGNPSPNPPVNPGGSMQRFTAISINSRGLKNDNAAIAFDQGYHAPSNTTILGYVDAERTGPYASLWFTVDRLGIAIQGGGPTDQIYMGFGDSPVPAGGSPGTRTSIADATLGIPEPATLLLVSLGAAVLAGRGRTTGVRNQR